MTRACLCLIVSRTSNPPVNSGCGFRSSLKTRNLVTRRKTYDLLRMVSGEPRFSEPPEAI